MVTRRKQARAFNPEPHRTARRKAYRVVCTGCGKEVFLEVPPPIGKELFCLECFKK